MNGLRMAAAFSIKPIEQGKCGPKDREVFPVLDGFLKGSVSEDKALEALQTLPHAMFYYTVIAMANGMDLFDPEVIESYWLGGKPLEPVTQEHFAKALKGFVDRGIWDKAEAAMFMRAIANTDAKPHHSLHVLYPIPRMALPQSLKDDADNCRVSWGTLISGENSRLTVEYQPLIFEGGRIALGGPVHRVIDRGFLSVVHPGVAVSFHLGMGIQTLSSCQVENLTRYTLGTLEALNR